MSFKEVYKKISKGAADLQDQVNWLPMAWGMGWCLAWIISLHVIMELDYSLYEIGATIVVGSGAAFYVTGLYFYEHFAGDEE